MVGIIPKDILFERGSAFSWLILFIPSISVLITLALSITKEPNSVSITFLLSLSKT